MIISHSNKFIGIKTRKTASSSIEIGLNRICGKEDYINGLREHKKTQKKNVSDEIEGLGKYSVKPHTKIDEFKNKAIKNKLITENQGKNYFKFTSERNPGDKVISLYFHRLKGKNINISFDEFMRKGDGKKCYNWLLYTIKDNIEVDYIIKYENLVEDLNKVSKIIGKDIKLFNENQLQRPKNKRNYRNFYNNHNKNLVYKNYIKEINYFGYKF